MEGDKPLLRVVFREADIDSFTMPLFFNLDPPSIGQFMSYEGILTKDGVPTSPKILGWTALTVYKHRNISRIVVIFELETVGNDFVTIVWLNKNYEWLSGASVTSEQFEEKSLRSCFIVINET